MPRKTTVGALVVVYHAGPKSTYRWVDEWTYRNIVLKDLQSAREQLERARRLLPEIEAAARSMTEKEFLRTYKTPSSEALHMLRNPVQASTLTLRTIEVEPIFKGTYLGYGSALQINFKEVKRVDFKEMQKVDDSSF